MTATPGQAAPFHWHGTMAEFDAEVRRRWIESSQQLGLDHGMPNAAAALAAQEPHAAPDEAADLREAQHAARTHRERLQQLLGDTPFEFKPDWASEYEDESGDVPVPEPQPAPELAYTMAESRRYREALDNVFAVLDRQLLTYAERISYARTLIRTAREGK